MNERTIVCAAIRSKHIPNIIVCGPRHFDQTMHQILQNLHMTIEHTHGDWEQGFVDQAGVFLSRHAAYTIARRSGQLDKERNGEGFNARQWLCSEGIY